MVIGRVINAAVDTNHKDIDAVAKNFTFYIHTPENLITGEGDSDAHVMLKTYER